MKKKYNYNLENFQLAFINGIILKQAKNAE
jgi:hypothetical protein